MKRTGDTRRKGVLRSLFLADPYRKLIAVGLAAGLWHYLDSQVSDTYQMDLSLSHVETGPENEFLGIADPNDLHVQVPRVRYTVRGYENALTGDSIQSVSLDFSGPKHLISRLTEEQPVFVAHDPGNEDLDQQGGFEFSVDEIRVFLDFQGLIERMTPSRVKVVLERNQDEQILLATDRIVFELPSEIGDEAQFLERLLMDQAVFSVPEAVVYGPRDEIPALRDAPKQFEVTLRVRPPDRVGGNLRLLEQFQHFQMNANPNVSIPVQPEPEEYKFSAVFILDDSQLGNREGLYKTKVRDHVFDLMVSGPLATILRSRSTAQQQEWADQHLRLWVTLPPTFDPTSVNVAQARPLVIDELQVDKRHYREKTPISVNIVEKDSVP